MAKKGTSKEMLLAPGSTKMDKMAKENVQEENAGKDRKISDSGKKEKFPVDKHSGTKQEQGMTGTLGK